MGKSDKRERKKRVIQRYLPNCYYDTSTYTYGNIPKSKINGACSTYAGSVDYEDVFGLIDETVFGSGKRGKLFTVDGFYSDGLNGLQKYIEGISFRSLPAGYNLTAMNEMLNKLYEIESEPSGWEIAGSILGAAFNFLQSASEDDEAETAETKYEVNYQDEPKLLELEDDYDEIDDSDEIDDYNEDIEQMKEAINYSLEVFKLTSIKIDNVLKAQNYEISGPIKKLKNHLNNTSTPIGMTAEEFYDRMNSEIMGDGSVKENDVFQKLTVRYQKKIEYYLLQLQDCDEDELEMVSNMCKNDLRKYQRKVKKAISELEEMNS